MIESIIQLALSGGRPSSGDDLLGFSMDADHVLIEEGTFVNVDLRRSGPPECLIEVRATVAEHVQSLQEVASALCRAWTSLAYTAMQATSCVRYREATVLRFVTATESGLVVTGRVVAGGGPQEELVARFTRDFGPIRESLGALPAWS